MKQSRILLSTATKLGYAIARPANFVRPVTFFEPSFLPKLPKVRDPSLGAGLSRLDKKAGDPSIRTLAFDGDSYLGAAVVRAVRDSEQFSLAAESHVSSERYRSLPSELRLREAEGKGASDLQRHPIIPGTRVQARQGRLDR